MKEICRNRTMSKRWNKLSNSSLRTLRKMDTYDHIDFESEELAVLRETARYCPRIRCLNAAVLTGDCMDAVNGLIGKAPKLEVLELYACRRDVPCLDAGDLVNAVCSSLPELRVLGLCREAVTWSMPHGAFSRIAEACPQLECLLCTQSREHKVDPNEIALLLAQCRNLKVLELFNMSFDVRKVFQSPQISGRIQLKTLVLGGCDFGDMDCYAVSKACPSLEHLDIGRTQVTDHGVAELTRGNLKLKSLFLFETNISDATLTFLSTKSKFISSRSVSSQRVNVNSRQVSLNSCKSSGNMCITTTQTSLDDLQLESVRRSDHCTQSLCTQPAKSCSQLVWPDLRLLDVCDCPRVTPESIKFFERERRQCQIILKTEQKQTDLHARCKESGVEICF